MGTKTGIEWTDSTWSPIRVRVKADAAAIAERMGYTSLVQIAGKMAGRVGQHCEHVSPGCLNCYAEGNNHRCLPANGTGLPYDRRSRDLVEAFVDEKALLQPLSWKPVLEGIRNGVGELKHVAHRDGTVTVTRERGRRIFVENQSDLFGEWITDAMLDRVFAVMALCPWHEFQVLTKRARRQKEYLTAHGRTTAIYNAAVQIIGGDFSRMSGQMAHHRSSGNGWWPLPNVWQGVSVENQAAADERIPLLLQTPAAVRFISAEPLLGPVNLAECKYTDDDVECEWNALTAYHQVLNSNSMDAVATADDGVTKLDWVICGGESGPGARPMHPAWARGLRDQCKAAGVPFFFKQWGEHGTRAYLMSTGEPVFRMFENFRQWVDHAQSWINGGICIDMAGKMLKNGSDLEAAKYPVAIMHRVGKKTAGAMLDGVEHKEFPKAQAALQQASVPRGADG